MTWHLDLRWYRPTLSVFGDKSVGGKKVTIFTYDFKSSNDTRFWQVENRYSEFHALMETLVSAGHTAVQKSMPRKRLLTGRKTLAGRAEELKGFLLVTMHFPSTHTRDIVEGETLLVCDDGLIALRYPSSGGRGGRPE